MITAGFIKGINECRDCIEKADLITAVVHFLSDETTADFAGTEHHCLFHDSSGIEK